MTLVEAVVLTTANSCCGDSIFVVSSVITFLNKAEVYSMVHLVIDWGLSLLSYT